jgi:hypothetical protein
MPAYAVFDVLEVTDQAKMGQYRQGVLATIQKYEGRVLVGVASSRSSRERRSRRFRWSSSSPVSRRPNAGTTPRSIAR